MSFGKSIKALVAACVVATTASVAHAETRLNGSGASFPFPIYSTWFQDFSAKTPDASVDYQSKGSGAGIQDLINGTVDFAGSDAGISDEDIVKVSRGVVALPMTAGEIVLAFNLEGIQELRLSREAYSGIFAGEIERWNDPAIAATNEGVDLPDEPIIVIRRSDSSGTTYVFTRHLSAIDPEFKENVGIGTTVQWPQSERFVAAPKNDGITAMVMQTPGAIGYIEYGYAKLTGTPTAALENKAGKFIQPNETSGMAALAGADLSSDDLRIWIDDANGDDAYPIATFTWLLFYEKYDDPKKAELARAVIEYGLTDGQKIAPDLGYIPLPEVIIERIREEVKRIK
ncbi:phosphate ABC transporter substrate-binding protein PstS [Rhodobacteraceae bacterium RKSG542]|uniref:phosphate ABC transporter substrate-binding protein PstS n=1 Tax=Pseudovibrio flavus TaxID=2529854 RepID=UPI0012BBD1E9|nr:phosphate ABC transporter substrate-binding protein PstS [Pseudovibrio flavus]MTI16300.1 phosphate ABC transporter substrate-binding protein PstS [Pseudovibrio flavus]